MALFLCSNEAQSTNRAECWLARACDLHENCASLSSEEEEGECVLVCVCLCVCVILMSVCVI